MKTSESPESIQKKLFGQALTKASQSRISLNIGGQIFETSKQTLLKYDSIFKEILQENNYIAEYLNSSPYPCYFFDRDPIYFPYILSFFRTGVFNYPKDKDIEQALKLELRFYQVKDLLEKSRFSFQSNNDRNGILYYLGSRNRYSFENPLDFKEIEFFLGDSYHSYLKSKLIEAPLKLLFDFSDKIPEDKVAFSPKNPNACFLIRFKSIRVKPNIVIIENVKAKDMDFNKDEVRFFGMRSEGLMEAVKEKELWIEIECRKREENEVFWKSFEIACDEFYNTIKIERFSEKNTSCQLMISGIEIYGNISEKS